MAAILLFVLGWTFGQLFESWSYFEIDNSLNVSDVLNIVVDCSLAVFILRVIGKRDEENRVEKDFYIKEYDKAQEVINLIEKDCSLQNVLSYDEINYGLTRCRKIIVQVWKQIQEIHADFGKQNATKQSALMNNLNSLNTKLTDTKYYKGMQNVSPLKITNRKIYLNNTIKPHINEDVSKLKQNILEMKILVNKM
jgi:hypothetical protein